MCQQEPLAVNTKTLLTQQSLHPCCVYRALSVCNVSLCWVMTLQSTEQHITLEQLSVPSEGLSTIMAIHKCRKIHWKLGRQVLAPLSSSCCVITQFHCQRLSHLLRKGIQVNVSKFSVMSFCFISSFKGRITRLHYWLTAPIMPFLWPPNQPFPVSLHYLLSSASIWKIWTWPGVRKGGSNYLAIQWERVLWHYASVLVKLWSFLTPDESGLIK